MENPFSYCDDGRVPLAGQEILAILVLLRWIVMGRLANQSSALGPLFQCVITMLSDTLKWSRQRGLKHSLPPPHCLLR